MRREAWGCGGVINDVFIARLDVADVVGYEL